MTKILAIDDKKNNLISLSAILKSFIPGCIVITALSGLEGIEKAKNESPDTILLDIKMPGMDGYEICKRLKADKNTRYIPVIMISAILTGSSDLIKGLEIGADAYLAKPIDEHVLIAQVKTALRMKTAEDTLRRQKELLEEIVQERTAELTHSNIQMKNEINERKRAEKALMKSENRFRTIFEQSPIGIAMIDSLTGDIYEVNSKCAEIAGRTLEEMTNIDWMSITHPDDVQEDLNNLALLNAGEITDFNINKRFIHPDGSHVWVNMTIVPIIERDKSHPRHLCMIEDITAARKTAGEKEKLEAQLQQAQKMESVGRLAGGIAHDYNNALTAIMGFTDLAMMDADPAGPLHANLNQILKAGKRATDITRQLLAFARKQTIAPEVLNLNNNVEGMLKMLRRLIGEDIDFAWLPGKGQMFVKMDPSQIDQILANLCVNARDAIEGVGKITIETATKVFDSDYCADHTGFVPGEFVMLAVTDNGCGMNKEILDDIFEPFFTTKPVDKGTGLGLSTVYGIVKQNKGFINVYSEPDEGTTIKIYLPRHEGKAVDIQEEATERIPQGHGETILLVEDDLSILKLTEKILNRLNYTVLTADTPKGAMRLAEEYTGTIHLLLTDVIMPEISGPDLANSLQSLYNPDLKRIFMSGYTANAIAHQGVLDQGVHFIQKPFSKIDLAKIVRKVLDENKN